MLSNGQIKNLLDVLMCSQHIRSTQMAMSIISWEQEYLVSPPAQLQIHELITKCLKFYSRYRNLQSILVSNLHIVVLISHSVLTHHFHDFIIDSILQVLRFLSYHHYSEEMTNSAIWFVLELCNLMIPHLHQEHASVGDRLWNTKLYFRHYVSDIYS
jgi:hypothetical protein